MKYVRFYTPDGQEKYGILNGDTVQECKGDYFREMELRVMSHLGRKVKIDGKGRKKSITLFYEDNEDLDELLTAICGKDFLDEI